MADWLFLSCHCPDMTSNFFITGTDTNVGKTVLSALLVSALDGTYWKPIQSGASEGTDRCSVMRWAELKEQKTLPECYCFDPPVSPHLAARMSNAQIDLSQIHAPDQSHNSRIIAEGAGGILTPLNDRQTMLDLARQLDFPVIVASRTSLGTINHTLLTLRALREAGAPLRGVVMIGEENNDNRRAIEWYGKVPVIGHVPWLRAICRDALLKVFNASFDKSYFGPCFNPKSKIENPK
jgi:dethiobiotin synthetase